MIARFGALPAWLNPATVNAAAISGVFISTCSTFAQISRVYVSDAPCGA